MILNIWQNISFFIKIISFFLKQTNSIKDMVELQQRSKEYEQNKENTKKIIANSRCLFNYDFGNKC